MSNEGFFSSLSPSLSLSWVCATSVGSVVMFLCSEWIHQLKNVLIIFIFYYTTRKPCQLGCRTLGRKREREQKGRRASEKEREKKEWKDGRKMERGKQQAKCKRGKRRTGRLRKGRTTWSGINMMSKRDGWKSTSEAEKWIERGWVGTLK